jgi:hypothetical protein
MDGNMSFCGNVNFSSLIFDDWINIKVNLFIATHNSSSKLNNNISIFTHSLHIMLPLVSLKIYENTLRRRVVTQKSVIFLSLFYSASKAFANRAQRF